MHIHSQDSVHFERIVKEAGIATPLVAVYCGSKAGASQAYTNTGYELGQALAEHGLGLVYGGACIGVMGAVADGVLHQNGVVVGVIPKFLLQKEVAHDGLTHLYTTDTMHTRKALMAGFASAFVVLAGGLGTLEELMEVATWRQLYQHDKPIILINTRGFYDGLLAHLRHTAQEGFMSEQDLERLVVCQSVEEAMGMLQPIISTPTTLEVERL